MTQRLRHGRWPAMRVWLVLLLALFAIRGMRIVIEPQLIKHDCALELQCAQLLLDGQRPYVDFYEINPPLIIYLNTVPAWLAQVLNWPVIPLFTVLVLILALGSTLVIGSLLKRAVPPLAPGEIGMLLLAYAAMSLFLVRGEFGQREQIFMLLYLPFFVLRWLRWEGRNISWLPAVGLGIVAALGVCLKPQFLIVAVAPELYWLIRTRSWRAVVQPETVGLVITGLAYGVHFLLLPGVIRESLFERWIPFIAQNYATYERGWERVLTNPMAVLAVVVVMAAVLLKPGRSTAVSRLRQPLIVLVLAGLLLYIVQLKGWNYHAIPFLYGTLLLAAVLIAESRLFPFLEAPRGVLLISIVVVLAGVLFVWQWSRPRQLSADDQIVTQVIRDWCGPGDPVMIISSSVRPAYPVLVQLKRRPGSRYLWHFPVGMFYAKEKADPDSIFEYHTAATAPAEEQRYLRELAEDIGTYRPMLIIVDAQDRRQGCPPAMNLWSFISRDEALMRALSAYSVSREVRGFRVFRR